MADNNILLYIIIGAAVLVALYWFTSRGRSENFNRCQPGDRSHCPYACTQFLYPDMYSPRGDCSDPFSWGFTYSTGRCPHVYYPQPRRLPSPAKEEFYRDIDYDGNGAPWFTHGGGARYDDPKHTTSTSYAYDYS